MREDEWKLTFASSGGFCAQQVDFYSTLFPPRCLHRPWIFCHVSQQHTTNKTMKQVSDMKKEVQHLDGWLKPFFNSIPHTFNIVRIIHEWSYINMKLVNANTNTHPSMLKELSPGSIERKYIWVIWCDNFVSSIICNQYFYENLYNVKI